VIASFVAVLGIHFMLIRI